MTLIRDSICDELGLSRGSDIDAIIDLISTDGPAWLDGLLTSENSLDSATESLRNIENYTIYISRQVGAAQEKYCKVHLLSDSLPCLVALFWGCSSRRLPYGYGSSHLMGNSPPIFNS